MGNKNDDNDGEKKNTKTRTNVETKYENSEILE